MNILGIDYGSKRIGMAWIQTGLDVVLPFGVIENNEYMKKIQEIVAAEKINTIIVGMPTGLDGKENANTTRVRTFIAELKSAFIIPVETIDERFTSAAADRIGGDASRDEKAAMIILQAYIDKSSINT